MSLDFYIEYKDPDTGKTAEIFERNITHNVGKMWVKAGIWDELYESNGKKPKEIIEKLRQGLKNMQDQPDEYKKLNPDNGWGSYESALQFLEAVIAACADTPNATVSISR